MDIHGLCRFDINWYNKKENVAEIFWNKGTRRYRGNILTRVMEENNVYLHTRMISEKRHHWKLSVKIQGEERRRRKVSGRNETPARVLFERENLTSSFTYSCVTCSLTSHTFTHNNTYYETLLTRTPRSNTSGTMDRDRSEQCMDQKNHRSTTRLHAPRTIPTCQLDNISNTSSEKPPELPLPGQPNNRLALNRLQSILEDNKENIYVRLAAVEALRRWQNLHAPATTTSMSGSWPGLSLLMNFKTHAKWIDAFDNIRPNDFRDVNTYILKLFVPSAISRTRALDGCCPDEALRFILELLQNNDNTNNHYSDDEYVASLIRALSLAYCSNKTRLSRIGLEEETKDIAILELRRVLGFYMNIRTSKIVL